MGLVYIIHVTSAGKEVGKSILYFQSGLIKFVSLCTFSETVFTVPYRRFRRSFKEKCPLSGAKTDSIREPWHILLCS